jgi:hypothetical protein
LISDDPGAWSAMSTWWKTLRRKFHTEKHRPGAVQGEACCGSTPGYRIAVNTAKKPDGPEAKSTVSKMPQIRPMTMKLPGSKRTNRFLKRLKHCFGKQGNYIINQAMQDLWRYVKRSARLKD